MFAQFDLRCSSCLRKCRPLRSRHSGVQNIAACGFGWFANDQPINKFASFWLGIKNTCWRFSGLRDLIWIVFRFAQFDLDRLSGLHNLIWIVFKPNPEHSEIKQVEPTAKWNQTSRLQSLGFTTAASRWAFRPELKIEHLKIEKMKTRGRGWGTRTQHLGCEYHGGRGLETRTLNLGC